MKGYLLDTSICVPVFRVQDCMVFADTRQNVDEVSCPRFIFVYLQILINNLNNDDDKETATIIRYHVNAIRNNLPFHRGCVKSE